MEGAGTGWLTHFLLNIQKVDIYATFCYTTSSCHAPDSVLAGAGIADLFPDDASMHAQMATISGVVNGCGTLGGVSNLFLILAKDAVVSSREHYVGGSAMLLGEEQTVSGSGAVVASTAASVHASTADTMQYYVNGARSTGASTVAATAGYESGVDAILSEGASSSTSQARFGWQFFTGACFFFGTIGVAINWWIVWRVAPRRSKQVDRRVEGN